MKELRLPNTPENKELLEQEAVRLSQEYMKKDPKHYSVRWYDVEESEDGTELRALIDDEVDLRLNMIDEKEKILEIKVSKDVIVKPQSFLSRDLITSSWRSKQEFVDVEEITEEEIKKD